MYGWLLRHVCLIVKVCLVCLWLLLSAMMPLSDSRLLHQGSDQTFYIEFSFIMFDSSWSAVSLSVGRNIFLCLCMALHPDVYTGMFHFPPSSPLSSPHPPTPPPLPYPISLLHPLFYSVICIAMGCIWNQCLNVAKYM